MRTTRSNRSLVASANSARRSGNVIQCTVNGPLKAELEPAAFDAFTPQRVVCPCSLRVTFSVAPELDLPPASH